MVGFVGEGDGGAVGVEPSLRSRLLLNLGFDFLEELGKTIIARAQRAFENPGRLRALTPQTAMHRDHICKDQC